MSPDTALFHGNNLLIWKDVFASEDLVRYVHSVGCVGDNLSCDAIGTYWGCGKSSAETLQSWIGDVDDGIGLQLGEFVIVGVGRIRASVVVSSL